ncbi:MAG TPA: TonB-dependent receptor [Vicinamibacterales bacterium]|nr:TonB-dependent receptor [Vicinamibacterales bacterium]
MRTRLLVLALASAFMAAAAANAYAQGGITSSLSGAVMDGTGAQIPGASVLVRNNGTGAAYEATTSDNGTFSIPALLPGTYTVTISLEGFKTAVLNDVIVNAAVPASVRATLEVGALQETVTVGAATEIVQTQTSAISTTVPVTQIANVPMTSRNVLDVVPLLPGFNTPGGNRNTTALGLPQSAINITLDGVNIQDNTLKTTDGFFTIVQPRLDAIEEVTVTTAAQGADSAGQGAVQIRFVTRSGTNELRGSAYHYYRNDKLNANTWFNKRNGNPKPELLQNQPGFRIGGPIVIPGLFNGRNKAFFFMNYEEFRQPSDVVRNRTILHPRAEAGIFRYGTSSGIREVDLFALAARNGQVSAPDPTIAKLLSDIRAATGTTGSIRDLTIPITQEFSYNVSAEAKNRYPSFRLDFNLTDDHRLSASGNYHTFRSTPDTLNNRDPRFPGFPATGTQTSSRRQFSGQLRSTLGANIVNEARAGYSGAPVQFFKELNTGMWGGTSVADQGGYYLDIGGTTNTPGLSAGLGITSASNTPTPSSRDATTLLLEDTVNWLNGRHSISFGGSFTQADVWLRNQTLVPEIDFGIVTGDPAAAMFTATNFPGAAAADLTRAQNLYALLVGRVSAITGNARIDEGTGQYTFLGPAVQRARMRDLGFFAQDMWRVRPNLSFNFGLRYELQLPFNALNNSYSTATMADVCGVSGVSPDGGCNLFQPGNTPGKRPEFINLTEGTHVYKTDWNNWAPSVGFNWTPSASSGFLRTLLGEPGDTSISGGFVTAYNRNGLSDFTNVYGDNPGVTIDVSRSLSLGNLGSLPVLFRNQSRLAPPSFPDRPEYPLTDVVTQDVEIFDNNIQVPWVQSWTIGVQREISRNMAVEVRYIGTRHGDGWFMQNFNELNIVENGFLNEFRLAQQNLRANVAAGRGSNFRYYGPGTGTSPLPIFLAYFAGLPAAQAGNAANYASTLFANNTFLNPLAVFNPQPYAAANALDADATRRANALRAGLPANFIVANPHLLGGAEVTTSGDTTKYHSLVLELRRRMSGGLSFQTNYVFGRTSHSEFYSFRAGRRYHPDAGTEGEVTHALKGIGVYELPFGRDRRFAGGAGPILDRIIGGWSVTGTARIQTGALVDLGNVRMVGFNEKDLRKMFKLRIDENQRVYMLPQEVIDNTVKAFSVSPTSASGYGPLGPPTGRYFAPSNGPDCIEVDPDGDGDITEEFGECGTGSLVWRGPVFKSVDLSVLKRVPLRGRVNAEFRFEVLNAFNNVNFVPVGLGNNEDIDPESPTNPNGYEVTALTGTQTSRVMQIVARFNW